jgi:exo-1,4-beta-D-glucosaminidase
MTLNDMPKAKLTGSFTQKTEDGKVTLDVHVENPTSGIALMVALKVVRAHAPGERVLPIFYGDNYVSLLPHESRQIPVEFDLSELGGDRPKVVGQGWNVPAFEVGE